MATNPRLEKVVKLTAEQYAILENGGTVGNLTGLSDRNLYLIQDQGEVMIDISEGITEYHKRAVQGNPACMIRGVSTATLAEAGVDDEHIFTPYYGNIPYYYSCLAADANAIYWIYIDWDNLEIRDSGEIPLTTTVAPAGPAA